METLEEVLKNYGDVLLSFSCYYKYCFMFSGDTPDGVHIVATVGGNHDDIYRSEFDNKPISLNQLSKENGITFLSGEKGETEIFSITDY